MRFSGCLCQETVWIERKLVCHFKLATGMVEGGIREFVNDMDGPAFLKRKLVDLVWIGTSRSQFTSGLVSLHTF